MKFEKKHKPVTKNIWKMLQYLPPFVRQEVIRSQFEINYELSSDYVFKQAETEQEIEEALNIVYESYSLLGYIDTRPEKLHFNAYLCLPTTTILIVKYKEEVVGTLSIVPDSPLGLPSEVTWDLSHIKANTPRIAEISSLSIKKSHKSSKGHLLLTLCKLMYEYCVDTLELDGIVIAATLEVEPFYTDLLLFEKVVSKTGQEHKSVKGNKSTCCYLNFHKCVPKFINAYNKRDKQHNLFHFFREYKSPNIFMPPKNISLHGLLMKKNKAMLEVLEKFPTLKENFTSGDKLKLANLDPTSEFEAALNLDRNMSSRIYPRVSIKKMDVILFHPGSKKRYKAQLFDVSYKGFGLKITSEFYNFDKNEKFILLLNPHEDTLSISATLQWHSKPMIGFMVNAEAHADWIIFIKRVFEEVDLPVESVRTPDRKVA